MRNVSFWALTDVWSSDENVSTLGEQKQFSPVAFVPVRLSDKAAVLDDRWQIRYVCHDSSDSNVIFYSVANDTGAAWVCLTTCFQAISNDTRWALCQTLALPP